MREEDLQKIEKNLRKETDGQIFERGRGYELTGAVIDFEVEDNGNIEDALKVSGKVRGSEDYTVLLEIRKDNLEIFDSACDCPYEFFCKHLVALGLHFVRKEKKKIGSINKTSVEYENTFLEKLKSIGIDPNLLDKKTLENLQMAESLKAGSQKLALPVTSFPVDDYLNKVKVDKEKRLYKDFKILIQASWQGNISTIKLESLSGGRLPSYLEFINERKYINKEDINLLNILEEYRAIVANNADVKYIAVFKFLELFEQIQKCEIKIFGQESHYSPVLEYGFPRLKEVLNLEIYRERTNFNPEEFKFKILNGFLNKKSNSSSSDNGKVFTAWGEDGLIIIANRIIYSFVLNKQISFLVSRAARNQSLNYGLNYYSSNGHYENTFVHTSFLAEEYKQINEIVSELENLQTQNQVIFKNSLVYSNFKFVKSKEEMFLTVEYFKDTPEEKQHILVKLEALINKEYFSLGYIYRLVNDYGGRVAKYRNHSLHYGLSGVEAREALRLVDDKIYLTEVSEKKEVRAMNIIHKDGANFGLTKYGLQKKLVGLKQITEFHANFLPKLETSSIPLVYKNEVPKFATANFRADFKIDADPENDLLHFNTDIYCGADKISIDVLEKYVESGGEHMQMPDGTYMQFGNIEEIKKFLFLVSHFRKNEKGGYEGKMYHAPMLTTDAEGNKEYKKEMSKSFSNFMTQAKTGKIVKPIKIDKQYKQILRNYQQEGLHWLDFLRNFNFGGILADDMGLGKTLQMITALSHFQDNKKANIKNSQTSIVVMPKTLLNNWESEINKFAPHLKILVVDGAAVEREKLITNLEAKPDIILTSYNSLQKDIEIYLKNKIKFHYAILDEAQNIKNPRTLNAHTVKKIPARYRVALTGTPLENSVEEIWSIFDFLMPGFLGNHAHFQKFYGNRIMKDNDNNVLQFLRLKISPFMLRRTKTEVLKDLPAKTEQIMSLQLNDEQNIIYQDTLTRIRNEIKKIVEEKGFKNSQIHILAGLTKLRQICNHPQLLLKDKKKIFPSVKLDSLMDMVREIVAQKRKVLIFSQFTEMLDIIKKELENEKINFAYMSGQTKDRKGEIEKFNENKIEAGIGNKKEGELVNVFLLSIKVGGTGLNLMAADTVIIFDPWWNPSVEAQAVDRAHRMGQKQKVNVYRLRTVGTIEEKIAKLQERKKNLFDSLVGESKDLFKKLTWEDVKELLS